MNKSRLLTNEILLSELLSEIGLHKVSRGFNQKIISINSFGVEGNKGNLQFTNQVLTEQPDSITFAPLGSLDCNNIIKVEDPKSLFFQAVAWLEHNIGFEPIYRKYISKTAKVHGTAVIASNVHIGDFSIIGAGVVLYPNVKIGNHSVIEANTVIGNSGFGVIRTKKSCLMVPHVGAVSIGNNVRVGALTTIDKATMGFTKIGDFTKIDDRVHIAHNCEIGTRNIICAGATIGGSVIIGDDCWIGLGCNIKQKIHINNLSTIGIGANIFHDTVKGSNMIGYPAKKMPS